MAINIRGTGAFVPHSVMDNEQISALVDTSDEWIRQRVGIKRRHIAKEETTVDMAVAAGEAALCAAGLKPEDLDMIIVSTMSSDTSLPCTACAVQERLGALNAMCFDINAACAGFLAGYQTAEAFLMLGSYKYILIIGSECLSKVVDWEDRATCILFGDGAGAAVVDNSAAKRYFSVLHSDGSKGNALTCPGVDFSENVWDRLESKDKANENAAVPHKSHIYMDGQGVFRFAVTKVPEVIREVLDKNNLSTEDIDYYVLHQANERIVQSVAKRLGENIEKFPMNLYEYGNTASASIPILLNELCSKKVLQKGNKIVLAGFGGGLTWGATVLEWNR